MKKYNQIIEHYENCLEKHGDSHLGVDWPNKEHAILRYSIMLDVLKFRKGQGNISLLDFGCGTAHLHEYISKLDLNNIDYSGLDISSKFIEVSKQKFPSINFYCGDILDQNFQIKNFDYIIMNGVFTEKRGLTFEEMFEYFKELIEKIFTLSNEGVAFNVMSKNVDWERDDLFHLSHDLLSSFLCKNITRNYIIRNDYGLYEYTVYLFK
jgi:SAM-dependent methyltransferase